MLGAWGLRPQVPEDISVGQVVDSVRLRDVSSESYALYLPTGYDRANPVPVVVIFDPAARGKVAVEVFRKAAEHHGWIVIASNDSRNGSYERSFGQADRLFADILSRYAIDPDRILVAGFSGGARLATTLAVMSPQIRGVFACGAAFSPNPGQTPFPGNRFAFAGVAGNRDMNFQEMHAAGQWLEKIQVPYRLFFFDGGHRWPSEDQILRAANWMSLEIGNITVLEDSGAVHSLLLSDGRTADSLFRAGRLRESAGEYRYLIRDYGHGQSVDSIREILAGIQKDRVYKKQLRRFDLLAETEEGLREKYLGRFQTEIRRLPPPEDLSWWEAEMVKLDKKYATSGEWDERLMADRLRNVLFAIPWEASGKWRQQEAYKKSLYCSRLLVAIFPENPYLYIRLAEEYALLKQPELLLDALNRAKDLGYTDADAVNGNKFFLPYRDRSDFPF